MTETNLSQEVSCYSTSNLIKYAQKHGVPADKLYQSVSEPPEKLANVHEWTSFETWTKLIRNIVGSLGERSGIYQDIGYHITQSELTNFQLFFFKVAPMALILSKISKHINQSICRNLQVKMTYSESGKVDIFYQPLNRSRYNQELCDFNRGASLSIMHSKGYRAAAIKEVSCVLRDQAPACHYLISWPPRPSLFSRIREWFLLRFGHSQNIVQYLEEKHRNLEVQYDEINSLKDKLQISRDFLNHILENVGDGVCWLDATGKIAFVNAAFRRMTGGTEEQLKERFFWTLLSPKRTEMDYRLLFIRAQEKKETPQVQEFEYLHPAGGNRTGETTFTWITEGAELPGFLVSVRDITERKKIQKQLFASEHRYRTLYENSPALIVGINPEGRFLYANPAMVEQSGYTEQELTSMHFGELVAPGANFDADRLVKNRLDREPRLQEVHFKTKKGGWKAVALSTYPVFDDDGALAAVSGIGIDVTETKRLNEQLLQTQRMDLLGQMAGGLAHDYRNSLMVIMGFSRLILKTKADQEILDYASSIHQTSELAIDLTQQLLTFSRGAVGSMEPFLLNALFDRARTMLLPIITNRIRVEIVLPDRDVYAVGDPDQLHQCLLNLGINARDALGENGGVIRLRLRCGPESDCAIIEVEDTGPGIPPDIIEKIFDPFFSTKEKGKGSGLGLSVVYGIIRSHKGRISVDSRPGEGALFRIELPLHRKGDA